MENGMMMMARGQDGSINLFGDMTIINQHTFAPRQQNPMMQMAQLAQLQMAAQNKQMELALEQQRLAIEAKKIDMLDRMQSNNLLGSNIPNGEKVLALDNMSDINDTKESAEDIEYIVQDSDNADNDNHVICKSDNVKPIKPNIFKLNIPKEEYADVIVEDYNDTFDNTVVTVKPIKSVGSYVDILDYYNSSGKLNDDIFERIYSSKSGYSIYHEDKPSLMFLYNTECNFFNLDIIKIIGNNIKNLHSDSIEKIEEHGLLVNLFYEFNKSMIIFIKPVDIKKYSNMLESSRERVEQLYCNYGICKELRNWFEDNNDNLKMCNIDKMIIMVQPNSKCEKTNELDSMKFNKTKEISVKVDSIFMNNRVFEIPMRKFVNTYTEINI